MLKLNFSNISFALGAHCRMLAFQSLCFFHPVFISLVTCPLVINVSQLGFWIKLSELRFGGDFSKKSGIDAKDRINNRLQVVATRNTGPIVNIGLIAGSFNGPPFDSGATKDSVKWA